MHVQLSMHGNITRKYFVLSGATVALPNRHLFARAHSTLLAALIRAQT